MGAASLLDAPPCPPVRLEHAEAAPQPRGAAPSPSAAFPSPAARAARVPVPPSPRIGYAAFSPSGLLLAHNDEFPALLLLDARALRRSMRFSGLIRRLSQISAYQGQTGHDFLRAQLSADRARPAVDRLRQAPGRVVEVTSEPLHDGGWLMIVAGVMAAEAEAPAGPQEGVPLADVLDFIPHGVCVYGPDRRLLMVNPAYARIMEGAPVAIGDTVEAVIRRRAEAGEFGPGETQEIVRREMARDPTRPQMRRRVRPNGTVIDVRTAPLPQGGHLSVVTDITQLSRGEAEAARRASEMEMMLASIRNGVVLFGADHRVIASNGVAAELLDAPPSLIEPGRHLADILRELAASGHFGTATDPDGFVRERLAMDRTIAHVSRIATVAGRHLEVRSDPAPNAGFVLTLTDMTQNVAAEAELRTAKRAAEASNQAKSRFLATMSHELRTPLNAIIGFSDTLMRDAVGEMTDPGQVEEFAQEINEAGRQLLSIVNNILDMARIDTGRFERACDRIDLRRLLGTVMRQFGAAAQAAELTLTASVPDGLTEIRADERRLQQVLSHLLSNAVKFTGAGGSIQITATLQKSDTLHLQVADTGIGIAQADLDRVFEPFMQLDASLDRRFQGAGLGLYVSKALVEAQGGRLTLRSRVGAGTVAEIRLPVQTQAAASAAEPRLETP